MLPSDDYILVHPMGVLVQLTSFICMAALLLSLSDNLAVCLSGTYYSDVDNFRHTCSYDDVYILLTTSLSTRLFLSANFGRLVRDMDFHHILIFRSSTRIHVQTALCMEAHCWWATVSCPAVAVLHQEGERGTMLRTILYDYLEMGYGRRIWEKGVKKSILITQLRVASRK
jgi:hypothetical protein